MYLSHNSIPHLIIDLQGFQYKEKDFVLKEMAAMCTLTSRQSHYLFEPPYSFSSLPQNEKDHYRWLENNYHGGLKWNDGYIMLSKLGDILRNLCDHAAAASFGRRTLSNDVVIICKGKQKKKFLKAYLEDNVILDLDDCPYSFPSFKSITTPSCLEHKLRNYSHCALTNVQILYKCILSGSLISK